MEVSSPVQSHRRRQGKCDKTDLQTKSKLRATRCLLQAIAVCLGKVVLL